MHGCYRHQHDPAAATCRDCKRPACAACIVFVPNLGPFCLRCALRRGGLRPRDLGRVSAN